MSIQFSAKVKAMFQGYMTKFQVNSLDANLEKNSPRWRVFVASEGEWFSRRYIRGAGGFEFDPGFGDGFYTSRGAAMLACDQLNIRDYGTIDP